MTHIIFDAETTSLLPGEGRVICIGCTNGDTGDKYMFFDVEEKNTLKMFWDYVRSTKYPVLVGYNSQSFDIPYIVHRSIVRNEPIPKFFNIDLRKTVNSFFISYDAQVKGKLSYWAEVLGFQQCTLDGSHMLTLFIEKKYEEIQKHCYEDVEITYQLFLRCKNLGLIDGKREYKGGVPTE